VNYFGRNSHASWEFEQQIRFRSLPLSLIIICYNYCTVYDNKRMLKDCGEEENKEAAEAVMTLCVID
jgi:hypothetical protein